MKNRGGWWKNVPSGADGWVSRAWLCHKESPGAALEGGEDWLVSDPGLGLEVGLYWPSSCCLNCVCHPASSAPREPDLCSAGGIKRRSWSHVLEGVAKGYMSLLSRSDQG